jgi:tripartite ATP-independent transporter DctM subunit
MTPTAAVLSPGVASLILFGVFFALMILRVPIAFALGLACLPILLIEPRLDPIVIFNETFKSYSSFILIAVPFFLLTANLMNHGGITDRLIVLSRALVGHFPGGLAQVNVLLSVFFAGISGSSTADAASQGKLFIEAQIKEGYERSFSVAITAVSAVLAVIVPPSILMIVWGGVLTVSIGALFLAGIIPGLLIGLVQMATVHVYAKRRGYPKYPTVSWRKTLCACWIAVPAMMTPVIIIGGKIFGWFTATESAAIAVLYALALTIFAYRALSWKGLYEALADTGKLSAAVLFCVGTASAFGFLLAYYQIPKALLEGVAAWHMGPIGTGFFIAAVFLVVGCFLDAIPAIIIVGAILQPLAKSAGMDPVHFAMIGIVSLAFGLVTPPYGLCLMISCAIGKIRLVDTLKDVAIMLLPMLAVLALCILWPDLVLFLPRLFPPDLLG